MKGKLILPYIMSNMLSGVGSAVMFYLSGFDPIWIGAFFATFTMPFFLMVLAGALGISRTSKNLPVIQLINLAAVVWAVYQINARGGFTVTSEYVAIGVALYGAITIQWYIRVFSNYGREPSAAIENGKGLPELSLQRLDGTNTTSASFAGEKTLLVFFRANWCPFCMNQLKEVKEKADQLAKAGVKVKFISNQGVKNSTKLAKDLDLPAHFEILQDNNLAAAKALGIDDIGGAPSGMPGYPVDTVKATVIGLDEEGKVIFGDETDNYRMRPHPETFLHVFEPHGSVRAFSAA
ncbi:Peroxiredoxin [Epibacterium ulvae]|uniref:thioredoxin-dependent peroxiredoxin n=1 Tax=Epibacterium ulvae TaxID=1156985 RepID=A0A1G5R5A9_9RHOB|nr:redoxin domain-containing protein [Epibacterium ulvae]SCZ69264.1 Peroxiredoxin [Epibacterium ulvae]